MTKPKPARKSRAEQIAAALHPQRGALKDGALALRAELFANATTRAPGKAMVYGSQTKTKDRS